VRMQKPGPGCISAEIGFSTMFLPLAIAYAYARRIVRPMDRTMSGRRRQLAAGRRAHKKPPAHPGFNRADGLFATTGVLQPQLQTWIGRELARIIRPPRPHESRPAPVLTELTRPPFGAGGSRRRRSQLGMATVNVPGAGSAPGRAGHQRCSCSRAKRSESDRSSQERCLSESVKWRPPKRETSWPDRSPMSSSDLPRPTAIRSE